MDPYRGSQRVGSCPRCNNTTETDGEGGRLSCQRGCGEWYPRETFDGGEWSSIVARARGAVVVPPTDWPWGPAACPICRQPMQVGQRADLRFDYCGAHGLWLDAGEVRRLAQVFKLS
jgi:uncharacterized protein YbaR (Trm112 family)